MRLRTAGFTLIELLIVIAIIAILAVIALPNFLEAQTRAKVTRVRADMRSLATALEAYAVDDGDYPQCDNNGWPRWIIQLSSPIAYITQAHQMDPFKNTRGPVTQHKHPYYYYGFNELQCLNTYQTGKLFLPSPLLGSCRINWWMLMSAGPDQERNNNGQGTMVARSNLVNPKLFVDFVYDPTNGTVSYGDIARASSSASGESARGLRESGQLR